MSDISEGFVLHFKGGSYVCRPERISDFEGSLRRHFDTKRRLVRGAFTAEGRPVDAACGQAGVLCGARLAELNLATRFIQDGAFLVPSLSSEGMMLALKWPAPAGMTLYFASECAPSARGWSMGECFLFARKQGAGGFWRLPLPNVFQDGRVCMGNRVRDTVHGATLDACFQAALVSFAGTTWNDELATAPEKTRALFRWDAARSPVAPPQDWERHCFAVSRNEMEELCPT